MIRNYLLRLYSFITNYRFRKTIKSALSAGNHPALGKEEQNKALLPEYYQHLTTDEIRSKATASLTSVSAVLAFSIAVLPLIGWKEFDTLFSLSPHESWTTAVVLTLPAFLLPYLSFWTERHISIASVEQDKPKEKRFWRSVTLVISLGLSACFFIGLPLCFPALKETLKHSFLLAGGSMILLSIVFFLFALEFYDSAAGWRGGEGLHFHLAGIASNSFIFGLSLALTGAALSVCSFNLTLGDALAVGILFVLVTMTEIERGLWDLDKEGKKSPTTMTPS